MARIGSICHCATQGTGNWPWPAMGQKRGAVASQRSASHRASRTHPGSHVVYAGEAILEIDFAAWLAHLRMRHHLIGCRR